jgi:predicted secreted protein
VHRDLDAAGDGEAFVPLTEPVGGAAAGAGGTYSWEFRALKKGTTTIIFTYSRSWDDSSSAEPKDTVQFTVTVK